MSESADLETLRSDLAFEKQTRGARFEMISTTPPEIDDMDEDLDDHDGSHDEPVTLTSTAKTIRRIVDLIGVQAHVNEQMFMEIAKSIGFDLHAVSDLADKVAEQEVEIEQLRRAVEDLRRGR